MHAQQARPSHHPLGRRTPAGSHAKARVEAQPEKVKLRKQLAEHPFGTIKRAMNQGYFLMRGLEKVRAEMALTVMAYNLKRAIKILGVLRIVAALA
jgi:transposase